jgi:hypothetical protein
VSVEEEAQYTRYIDDILNEVNLETVTRKAIRAELENKLGGKDLTEQKVCGARGAFDCRYPLCNGDAACMTNTAQHWG